MHCRRVERRRLSRCRSNHRPFSNIQLNPDPEHELLENSPPPQQRGTPKQLKRAARRKQRARKASARKRQTEAKAVVSDFSLSREAIELDCGLAACSNLPRAIALICNAGEKQHLRVAVAEALIHLERAVIELKQDLIKGAAPYLLETCESILLMQCDEIPGESRGSKVYEFGIQRIPEYLGRFLQKEASVDKALSTFLLPTILRTLDNVKTVKPTKNSAIKSGPAMSREEAIAHLIRTLPKYFSPPQCSQVVPVMFSYIREDLPLIRNAALVVLQNVKQANKRMFNNYPQQLFNCISEGAAEFFLSCSEALYEAHPQIVHANISSVLKLDLRRAQPLLAVIVKRNPQVLLPYVQHIVQEINNAYTGQFALSLILQLISVEGGLEAVEPYCSMIIEYGVNNDSLVCASINVAKLIGRTKAMNMALVVESLCFSLERLLPVKTKQEVLQTLIDLALSDEFMVVASVLTGNATLLQECKHENQSLLDQLQDAIGDASVVQESRSGRNADESEAVPRSIQVVGGGSVTVVTSACGLPLPVSSAAHGPSVSQISSSRKLGNSVLVNCKASDNSKTAPYLLRDLFDLLEEVMAIRVVQ